MIVKLAYIKGTKHATTLASQLLDVAVRVQSVRAFAVQQMVPLLCGTATDAGGLDSLSQVRRSAAWIVGEYASLLEHGSHERIMSALLQPATMSLSPDVQAVYLQCALKVLGEFASLWAARLNGGSGPDPGTPFPALALTVCQSLDRFAGSKHVEVQERATCTWACVHVLCSAVQCSATVAHADHGM